MRNIVDYVVVTGSQASKLTDKVNDYLQRGWQPLGITVDATHLFQVMVKYEQTRELQDVFNESAT